MDHKKKEIKMTFTEKIAEIKERIEKATEGPWFMGNHRGKWGLKAEKRLFLGLVLLSNVRPAHEAKHDMKFITYARKDLPWLIKNLEEAVQVLNDAAFNFSECISCNRMAHAQEFLKKLEGESTQSPIDDDPDGADWST